MKKTQKKINKLFEEIDKNPSKSIEILEQKYLENLDTLSRKRYNEIKKNVSNFRLNLESIGKRKLIGHSIKEILDSGQDKFLESEQGLIKRDMDLAMEKHLFIINILSYLKNKNLNEYILGLQEYLVSKIYLTYCESSIRLFTDILLIIVDYNLSLGGNNKYRKKQNEYRKKIISGLISLGDLYKILEEFDENYKNQNISKLIKDTFLYKEGKGFYLRNGIAHERISLKEIDIEQTIREIHKINMFNQAIIFVFYLEIIGSKYLSINLDFSKKKFKKWIKSNSIYSF